MSLEVIVVGRDFFLLGMGRQCALACDGGVGERWRGAERVVAATLLSSVLWRLGSGWSADAGAVTPAKDTLRRVAVGEMGEEVEGEGADGGCGCAGACAAGVGVEPATAGEPALGFLSFSVIGIAQHGEDRKEASQGTAGWMGGRCAQAEVATRRAAVRAPPKERKAYN